ncbi:hypothetical protein R69927_00880 [Paraburkholderia domus]|uniref:hypothetical protein n=1 Tax=Paraburkholderia domus TaxID=2793075 RepID=UPI001914322C|nr:hypothetical protein [Paraburkholderia domus]MBK5085225.1 hypothetical protein [Burkholderia sp. R-69927]CAE6773117.1 hypothetical protein R75483_04107 [Paraburkholderia domus]CAE6825928.1 hypothetical protein R69927_00880 [Paraburkholderia domus]
MLQHLAAGSFTCDRPIERRVSAVTEVNRSSSGNCLTNAEPVSPVAPTTIAVVILSTSLALSSPHRLAHLMTLADFSNKAH